MKLKTLATAAVGAVAMVLGTAPQGELGFASASAQSEAVRPEVGKPLKEAGALVKAGKYKDALAKVKDAEAVSGRTANENFQIEYMRMAAGSGAQDTDAMVKGFEALKASGRLAQPDQLRMIEAIAGTYLRNKDAGKALTWSQRYFKEGGNSATMKEVQSQAQYLSGDMTSIIRETSEEIAADEKAGRTPAQNKLNLLLNAAMKAKDTTAEGLALEKLLAYYPRKELWADVLGRVQAKPSFSDRFSLDVYRLKLASGNMRDANDYMEMAQLAVQAGFPDEAKLVVDKGFASNVLGQGAEGARHKRLQDLVLKKVAEAKAGAAAAEKDALSAKDGNGLVSLGLAAAFRGQGAQGAKLVDEGIAKGNLKRPEDAKLYLGLAYFQAGDMAKAQAAWRTVKGTDGAADLARLWSVYSRSNKR